MKAKPPRTNLKPRAEPRAPSAALRRQVAELRSVATDVVARHVDWSSRDGWHSYEATACDPGGYVKQRGAWAPRPLACEGVRINDEPCPLCGREPEDGCEGPMMNYAYGLPNFRQDPREAAVKIIDLPLVLIEFEDALEEDSWALALAGGGMDLSWEICAAYCQLGYLPPVAFASLPAYSGRGKSAQDQLVLAALEASARVQADLAARDVERVAEIRARLRKGNARSQT